MNILIVEDFEDQITHLSALCVELGHTVTIARTLDEGLKLAQDSHDLAISDWNLPDNKTSLPILERLVEKSTPIIINSGSDDQILRKFIQENKGLVYMLPEGGKFTIDNKSELVDHVRSTAERI